MSEPSETADSGRGADGKFRPGNKIAVGNPHSKRIAQIRAALFRAVTPADVRLAVKKLVEQAKDGDRLALAELLDRTIGKAVPADLEERLNRLEQLLEQRTRQP